MYAWRMTAPEESFAGRVARLEKLLEEFDAAPARESGNVRAALEFALASLRQDLEKAGL